MRRIILVLTLLLAAQTQAQETRYVTDILQLGLFPNQDATGQLIRNLVSGTEVTVLERIPNFARVRTAAGEEGWVKSAYLVEEKPAQLRVAEVEATVEQLQAELEAALLARDAAAADAEVTLADAANVLASAEADSAALQSLQDENANLLQQVDRYRGAVPWPLVIGALAVALIGGFLAGYWWLDASIRRRHGGFRVH
jgi:hypothetical protein